MSSANRLISVDVFRGFTMAAMILVNYPGQYGHSYQLLTHAHWTGITPTDFIFPFFIFILGVSISLSFSAKKETGTVTSKLKSRILVRTLKIYVIGLLLHYLPDFDFSMIDLFGVLQRIALVYMACAFLFIYSGWKTQSLIFAGILVAYWLTLSFVPTGTFPAGTIEQGVNFAAWFDRLFFSADLLGKKGWNSEGLYSTFPAIATGISGMLTGSWILTKKVTKPTVAAVFFTGLLLVLTGWIWGFQFPVIKKIWTSSYVLVTSGWAMVFFSFFLWLIDVMQYQSSSLIKPAIIFGTNAVAIYVVADLFETLYKYTHIHDWFYGGLIYGGLADKGASLLWALFSVFSCFFVAFYLYRKKIFIKV